MQEENGALSWTGFLGKLVTILGAIFLILVVLSWLRCSARPSGSQTVSESRPQYSGATGFLYIR